VTVIFTPLSKWLFNLIHSDWILALKVSNEVLKEVLKQKQK